jgi:glutamate dehydrogenase/leucine dehydrogenase
MKNAEIKIGGGNCGIVFDPVKREYKFHVRRYFEDFKKAVNDYISGLHSGFESVILMERALRGKPEII